MELCSNLRYHRDMSEAEKVALLEKYSRAEISAVELRRAMGGITYGDPLIELGHHDLPLPRASQAGREARLAEARALLFHRAV